MLLVACDPPISPPLDGGGVTPIAPLAPMPPAAVVPPDLGPCPTGFTARPTAEDPSVVVCDPWPESGPASCAADEAHFVGEPGCVRVGPACPDAASDGFATDLPTDGTPIVFVRAGATGGDGTRGSPFGVILDAVVAARGGILALAPGEYDGNFGLVDTVLWGACVDGVHLFDSTPGIGGAIVALSSGASMIRNVRLTGAADAFLVSGGADVVLESVVVEDPGRDGLRVARGGEIVVRDFVVRRSSTGSGIRVLEADGLVGHRVSLEATNGSGLTALAVPVSIDRLAIRDVTFDPSRGTGAALVFAEGAVVEITESSLEALDLVVMDRGAGLTIRDASLRSSSGAISSFSISDAISITLERVDVASHVGGLAFRSTGASYPVTLTDVVVRGGTSGTAGYLGSGIDLDQIDATLERVVVLDHRHLGVRSIGGSLRATDLRISGVTFEAASASFATAGGLLLDTPTSAHLERIAIDDVDVFGLATYGGEAEVEDVSLSAIHGVEHSASAPDFGGGVGLYVGGTTGTISRVEVHDAVVMGAALLPSDGSLVVEDLSVADVHGSLPEGYGGWGVGVYDGDPFTPHTSVTLRRVRTTRARAAAVFVGIGIDVRLEHARLEDTLAGACGELGVCTYPGGTGVTVLGGHASLDQVVVRGSALAGLYMESEATIVATATRLEHNPFGVAYSGSVLDPALLTALELVENDTDVAIAEPWTPMPPDL